MNTLVEHGHAARQVYVQLPVNSLDAMITVLSPNLQKVAILDSSLLRVHDISTNATANIAYADAATHMWWAPNSRYLVTSSSSQLSVWDITAKKRMYSLQNVDCTGCVWTTDSLRFALLAPHCVYIGDARTWTVSKLPGEISGVVAQWAPTNSALLAVSNFNHLEVWNVNTQKCFRQICCPYIGLIAWAPDSTRIATVQGDIRVWNMQYGECAMVMCAPATLGKCGLSWSPDGQWLATREWTGTITVYDTSTGFPLTSIVDEPGGGVYSLLWSPGSRWIYTSSRGAIRGFDWRTWIPATAVTAALAGCVPSARPAADI